MSTQNTSPPDQKRYRTFEDVEAYQVAREFRKSMSAYGLTEDQLDELLAETGGPPA
jgi:hypothetical protein